ncbi:MAG: hypothetical protein ACTSUE_25020 [Promethearchaeota archaeon]
MVFKTHPAGGPKESLSILDNDRFITRVPDEYPVRGWYDYPGGRKSWYNEGTSVPKKVKRHLFIEHPV